MRRCVLLLLLAACQKLADFDAPPERGGQCSDGIDNDGDGDSDCTDSDCATVCGFIGCGNGKVDPDELGFAAPVSVQVPGGPLAVLPASIGGDALTDLYVATGNGVRELRNNGGVLVAQTPVDTSTIGAVLGLAVGRFDSGTSDDAVLMLGGSVGQVLPVTNDAGTLRAGRVVPIQQTPLTMVAGAFDSRAGDDLLLGGTENTPFLANDGAAVFTATFPSVPATPRGLAVGDQDGDGDRDVMVAASSVAYLLTNTGATASSFPFRAEKTVDISGGGGPIAFLDADGANHLDAVVLEPRDQRARILLDAGGGMFNPGATLTLGGTPVSLVAADLDLDGFDDVLVGLSGGSIILFVGDGKGAFMNAKTLSATSAEGLTVADLDGKRGLEVVVAEKGQNRVSYFPNTSRHEECDDGNTVSGDGCNADCTLP